VSDDDPVERFVDRTFDGEGDESGVSAPKARDMEAELRERTGTDGEVDADDLDVDSETASAFWAAVVYVNVGIFLVALGPTVYAIRGFPLVSAGLSVAGAFALYRAYSVYRRFEAEREDAADEETAENDTEAGESDEENDAETD